MSYTIFTDTASNLPFRILQDRNIQLIYFDLIFDGELKRVQDCEVFDDISYYSALKNGSQVITSQISPQKYIDAFEKELKNGNDVLYVGMSSGISGSFASSLIAVQELREMYPERTIYTFDTMAASLAEGIAVLYACDLRDEGKTIHEVHDSLFNYREHIAQIFTVSDLMHLKKTGRLSNASAVIGTILNIKPLLMGNEKGQIVAFDKVRGRKASIEAIAKEYLAKVVSPEKQIVGIAHAMCEEDAQYLISLMEPKKPKEILLCKYEMMTGSHVGPGALALFFNGNYGVRIPPQK